MVGPGSERVAGHLRSMRGCGGSGGRGAGVGGAGGVGGVVFVHRAAAAAVVITGG